MNPLDPNQILPNMRLLSIQSENLGEDWFSKSLELDQKIQIDGFDLAEESIFLIFDRSPGSLIEGLGTCQVSRSVIGPKKIVVGDFTLSDWVSAPVHKEVLKSKNWTEIFPEAFTHWENLQKANKKISSTFFIKLTRRLKPGLDLGIEAYFHGES